MTSPFAPYVVNQAKILGTYTTLSRIRSSWGGLLVLSVGLSAEGAALAIAANIAGAVSLSIDDNPVHIREVVRSGAADFVVTTVDEALRAMKNEVRRHSPLSVALNAAPLLALEEIVERGFVPQIFSVFGLADPQINNIALHFESLGSILIHFSNGMPGDLSLSGFNESSSILEPFLENSSWELRTYTFENSAELRAFDARLLGIIPEKDRLRRRWVESAPRILRRQSPPQRVIWLTEREAQMVA
jgi:urocanate hydratase